MNVLIVEDEARISEGLEKLFRKIDQGYQVVGIASDGEEGLKMLREMTPDLVVTDIRMPKMDGLQMLSQMTREGIKTKAIVLSAYSEFEYARKAMKLGVTEYLLKPISINDFSQALANISQQLEKENHEKPLQVGTLEQIFRDFLDGNSYMDDSIERYLLKKYKIRKEQNFILICTYLGNEYEEKRISAKRYLQHAFSTYPDICFEIVDMESKKSLIMILYHYENAHDIERWIQSQLLKKKTEHLTLGWIEIGGIEKMEEGLKNLYPYMDWNLSFDEEILISYPKITNIFTTPCIYPIELETRTKVAVCAYEWDKVRKCMNEFHGRFSGKQIYSPKEIKDSYVRFVWSILGIAKEIGCAGTDNILAQNLLDQIMNAKKRDELMVITDQFLAVISKDTVADDTVGLTVRRVKSMIHEFYQSGITLEEIGDKLHVTPEYLGTQFHKEMGMSFNTYMKNYRINKAKELLCGTQLKLYEIADRIGYSDSKYFSKMFKEVTGQLPAEYRKTHK